MVGRRRRGSAWVVLHAVGLLDASGLHQATIAVLALLTLGATIVGILRWRPSPAWPWVAAMSALPLFAVGAALRAMYGTLGQLDDGRSPVPELVTLPGYALLAVGVYGLIRSRTRDQPPSHRLDIVIDAALAALAALALAWAFLMSRIVEAHDVPTLIRILLAAYPPMSVFLVALSTRLTFVQGRRSPVALRFILGALTCLLVGDLVYTLVELGELPNSRLVELPYALAYIGMMMAALHPTMRLMTLPALTDDETRPSARLAIVAFALCIPAVVSIYPSDRHVDRVVLAAIVVMMTAVAALRMYRALRAARRLRRAPRLSGDPRSAHRATEPRARPPAAEPRPGQLRRRRGAAVHRHRPVQARERLVRARPGRRAADRRGAPAGGDAAQPGRGRERRR